MESVDFDSLYDKLMKLVHKRSHKICPIRRRHEVEGSWRIDTLCVEFQRRTMSQYPGYSVCQACQEYEAMTSLFSSNGANQALYVVKKNLENNYSKLNTASVKAIISIDDSPFTGELYL